MIPKITVCISLFLASMTWGAEVSAQQRAPPAEEGLTRVSADRGDASSSPHGSLRPFRSDPVPLYRYPTFDRGVEIGLLQTGAGAVLGTPLWVLGSGALLFLSNGDTLTNFGAFAFISSIFYIPGTTLTTYALGRANGSNASFLGTLAGSMAGATVSTLVFAPLIASTSGRPGSPEPIVNVVTVFGSYLLPLAGAIVGYQLTSTWDTGQTVDQDSPALSFGIVPTRSGALGSVGFSF